MQQSAGQSLKGFYNLSSTKERINPRKNNPLGENIFKNF